MPETIGQQLQKARVSRGLTVDQAARALHIRPNYLIALEEDRRKELPSPVHAKGFLRLYAGYLDLAVQPLLDIWEGKPPAPPPPAPVEAINTSQPESEAPPIPTEPVTVTVEPPEPSVEARQELAKSRSQAESSFFEIGRRLKSQRQALGLSTAEVERYTHVRQRYLEALEEGRIEDLPSTVQGRGMLSNYAHFLNLDVEGLLLEFAEGLQAQRVERLAQEAPVQKKGSRDQKGDTRPRKGARRLLSPDLLISSLVVIMILGFALWTAAQVDALNTNHLGTSTPPSLSDVLLNQSTNTPPATGTATQPPLLSTLAPGEVRGGGAAVSTVPAITLPAGGTAPVQLYVIARQRAYLRITADEKIIYEGRVAPGNAYSYTAEKRIELLTGSAAALQVIFNQKDLGVLGQVGQVKDVIFTKDGAVTPTPRFTATLTRTTQPTSTIQPTATLPTPTITPFIP